MKVLKTDVTVVKIIGGAIFVGEFLCSLSDHCIIFKFFIGVGRYLLIFSKSGNELLKKLTVFEEDSVYDIQVTQCYKKLLLYGANKLKTFKYNHILFSLEDENFVAMEDWILAAKWLDNGNRIAVVSMHNNVSIWTEALMKIESFVCSERCILYSAFICDNEKDIIILSGTVFSEVLIWLPVPTASALCPVSHRLVGHKV